MTYLTKSLPKASYLSLITGVIPEIQTSNEGMNSFLFVRSDEINDALSDYVIASKSRGGLMGDIIKYNKYVGINKSNSKLARRKYLRNKII